MHDSTTKFPTTKNFHRNGVSDKDHHFRGRKHAQNHPVEDPGYSSPTWWTPSSIKILNPLEQHHHGNENDHKRLQSESHDQSRIEAIERGQKELMEMAIKMTEPSMELSMTGLVELETPRASPENERLDEKCLLISNEDVPRKNEVYNKSSNSNQKKKAHVHNRSSSVESGGLLLKIICPFSLGSKKKKKAMKNVRSSSGSESNDIDKDWWSVKSGDNDCGGSSRYSTSKSSSETAHSHTNICRSHSEGCCLPFLSMKEQHGRGN